MQQGQVSLYAHTAQVGCGDNQVMKRLLLLLLFMTATATSFAQELRIGVIMPLGGPDGTSFEAVVSGTSRSIRSFQSPSMRNAQLLLRDDGGNPVRAAAHARELVIDEEVHVLVCCRDLATLQAVQPVAEELQVLTLALAGSQNLPAGGHVLSLQPDLLSALRAATLGARRHAGDVSLMTSTGDWGDQAEEAFRAGALEAGLPVMRVVRFEPGAAPLTPEALLAATSQAEAILVWAGLQDSREAVRSLRARGWTGPVLVDYWQAEALAVDSSLGALEYVVPPAAVTGSLPAAAAGNQTALSSFRVSAGLALSGAGTGSVTAALLSDALQLALRAYEQALVYGAQLSLTPAQARSAVHDGLVGAGTVPLAAGTYRYLATSASLAQPDGQIPVSGRNGRFTALDR